MKKIPVILDTDIGEDIDDLWALCYLLKCPELDLKLLLTDTEDTVYRAKVACKFLSAASRTDIPVGVGMKLPGDTLNKTHALWVEDYDLTSYPGVLKEKGVDALIDAITGSDEPVTLIAIGPLPNIAEALKREPDIARNCRFVGMHGSIRKKLNGLDGAVLENNVARNVQAAQAVFKADWLSFTITPLDSCAMVRLTGEKYKQIRECPDPALSAVIENYRLWTWAGKNFGVCSSILFDTVAVYLAFASEYLVMEKMPLIVTDDGYTREDKNGIQADIAVGWKDIGAFENHLVARLTGRGR